MKLLLDRGHNWCLATTDMASLVGRMGYWVLCKASGRRTVDRVMSLVVLHTLKLWVISHQGMSFSPAEK